MFENYGVLAPEQSILANPMQDFSASFAQNGGIPGSVSSGAPGGVIGGGLGPMGIAGAAVSGIQALGSLWMAHKASKLAKKQFKFTKDITNTNLANQIKSYNTALADRARSRGVMESQTQGEIDSYVNNNSLSRDQNRPTGYNANYYGSSAPTPSGSSSSPATPASGVSGFSALAARAAAERDPNRRLGG